MMNHEDDGVVVPDFSCPSCGYKVDRAKCVTNDGDVIEPEEGDVSLCLKCADISIFNADGTQRPPTPDELVKHITDPKVQRFQRLILQAHGERRKLDG